MCSCLPKCQHFAGMYNICVLAFARDDLYLTNIFSYTAHIHTVANDEQYIHQRTLMWHNNSKYNHGQLSRTCFQG